MAWMLILVFTILMMTVPASAEVITGKAVLVKSYNKDGKFCMVVDFNFVNDGGLNFEIFLTDEAGDVYDRWNNISLNCASEIKQYVFSRSYANTPTGLYTMNVVATTLFGDSKTFSWAVNHKKVASATFKDTFKVKNQDGTYSQKFRFSTNGGKDKTYHLEIYTSNGEFVTSFQTIGRYDTSIWSETWNYFPESGVKMQSGTYILKYWIGDGNPQQKSVKITI